MTLYLVPEATVPVPAGLSSTPPTKMLPEHMAAAAKTVELLATHGLEVTLGSEDCKTAGSVLIEYAKDPEAAAKAMTEKRIGTMTPAALRAVDHQLRIFSHQIVDNAEQVRNYVTNRLLEETDNPDPRIRIKALELLGKVSDVGLFAERSEVTVTHRTSDELRDSLRQKLSRLVNDDIEDAQIIEAEPLSPAALDSAWDDG
jgi:PHP family Zn ribbon phosphoesterase